MYNYINLSFDIVDLTFKCNDGSIGFIMKKVFKIRLLNHILITLVLYLPLYISLSMNALFVQHTKLIKMTFL